MIILERIDKSILENRVYFRAYLTMDGKQEELWYSADVEYEPYINMANADAFVLMLFVFAVFNAKKLVVKVPISTRLKYGINELLLPAFRDMGFNVLAGQFDFQYEDQSICLEGTHIGAAMSFGVDSFYTIKMSEQSTLPVDTLTLFNAGAFGQYGGEEARRIFEGMKGQVHDFAIRTGKRFLWIDSNISDVLPMKFVQTHSFRNISCVLAFQRYFRYYYYSAGVPIQSFKLNELDPAYYDLLTADAVRTPSLEFLIAGMFTSRMEKTALIAEDPHTYHDLNVCFLTPDNIAVNREGSKLKNCSQCPKCIRTMTSLDVLGKLENYKSVFDLNMYNLSRAKYFGDLIYMKFRNRNIYAKEILAAANSKGYKIPLSAYTFALRRLVGAIKKRIG